MRASMDISQAPHEEAQHVFLYRAVGSFTGNMHLCKEWMKSKSRFHMTFCQKYPHFCTDVLSSSERAACINPACGLGAPWYGPGHVCKQPCEWAHHHSGTLPAGPLVGYKCSSGDISIHCVCCCAGTKQVRLSLFGGIHLHCDIDTVCPIFYWLSAMWHFLLREAISAGLCGFNGTLVGMLMAVFSVKGSWYWWLLLPNIFMSLMWLVHFHSSL